MAEGQAQPWTTGKPSSCRHVRNRTHNYLPERESSIQNRTEGWIQTEPNLRIRQLLLHQLSTGLTIEVARGSKGASKALTTFTFTLRPSGESLLFRDPHGVSPGVG